MYNNDPYKNNQGPAPHQQHAYAQPYAQPYGQPQYAQPYGQPQYAAQPVQHFGGQTNVQDVTPIKPESAPPTGCRDLPFAVVFLLNVAAIVGLMVVWGFDSLKADSTPGSSSSSSDLISPRDAKVTLGVALGMSVLAVVLALLSVKLIVAYARCMINFTLWFSVGLSFAIAALGFYIGSIFLGVFGVILGLLGLCYARAVQHRIPFAAANLHVAAAAISKHWSTYLVAILFTIVQIVWVIVWAIALLGVANHLREEDGPSAAGLRTSGERCFANSECASNSCRNNRCYGNDSVFYKDSAVNYVIYFFMLVSFYWGLQVFKNVSHTTIAGTVATFWYNAESSGATGSSLKRSMTTSFGSICFGSLLVAIVQALRELANQAREEGSFLGCIAECLLGCLQAILEYINRWAFVYVGIYGYKFTQAGKAVFDLFHNRGFDAIINDDLIGNVLSFAALGVGLICAGVGVAFAHFANEVSYSNSMLFLGILGFVVGVGVAVTPLSVIDSSVATIFVCFAEDPVAFQQSHPDLYQPLVTEWHNLYPEIMVQAGYWHA
ncbi:hypothetical protein ATCC90586_006303 [Pythium insidiosum]|nr:hypothetical protein ATCC90586_006303 [Pythium insidiosum]